MINKTKLFSTFLTKFKKPINISIGGKFIKSIFFIKYLVLIFTLAMIFYLFFPKFLNYEKKINYIENLLQKNYNINLISHTKVSYNIFPSPRINIKDSIINFDKNNTNSTVKKLQLVLNFSNIYNNDDLKLKKIVFKESKINLNIDRFQHFIKYIFDLNNYIYVQNSKILLKNYKEDIIILDNIKFNNRNKKNLVLKSKLMSNKFFIKFFQKKEKYNLVLLSPNLGIKVNFEFDEDSKYENFSGLAKIKILDNNLKFEFDKNKKIEVRESYFRNKFLQTSLDGNIETKPYFNFSFLLNLDYINIKKIINQNIFTNLDNITSINPKLNGTIKIKYKEKKINRLHLKKANIFINFINGDIKINKFYLLFNEGDFELKGFISNINGYKKLNFYITANLTNKKQILKTLNIKNDNNFKLPKTMYLDGYINLPSYKINFNKILNDGNQLTQEDVKIYKNSLENLLINEGIVSFFDLKKVRNFITEIY